jgi:serine/threonine protein kinase
MPIPSASPKQPATSDNTVMGTVIEDRYRLERLLGSGGMSRVYLGTHVRAGGKLAIKLIDVRLSNKPDMMQRCLQEARTMMEIQSSHVVRAYDVGMLASGQLYIVMEYLAGLDLEQLLQRDGPLPWQRLAAMAVQICNGLATAHAHGTIHRDIKPQNCVSVTIDGNPDHIKLIDFGIARDANAESGLTQDGAILGTPEYMAPELVGSGMPPDARSDIYAVGATLYKMLTGEAPFRGRDALDTLYKHRNAPIIPPSKAAPKLDIPKEADAILVKALAKDPAQRYQSAEELAHAIRAAAGMPALGMRIRDPLAQSPIPRSPTARIAAHSIPRDLANNEASSPGRMSPAQEVSTAEMRPVSMKELIVRGATLFSVSLVLGVASWLAAPSSPPTPASTLVAAPPTTEPEPVKAPEPTKEPEPTKADPPVEPTPDPEVKPPPVDPPPVDPPGWSRRWPS